MKVNLSIKSLKEQIRFLQSKLNLLLIYLKVPIPSFQQYRTLLWQHNILIKFPIFRRGCMNFVRTEVAEMKSFILEQSLLIKQNQKLVNEQSISDCENNCELIKSLDQIEYLRRKNSAKSNIISSLLNNKVLFNN